MATINSSRVPVRNPTDSPYNRACDACRHHKVRCLPDTTVPDSKICQRCAKANRECLFTAPQKRKQRKRTDTRVAELEREVQAMRALFDVRKKAVKEEAQVLSLGMSASGSHSDGKNSDSFQPGGSTVVASAAASPPVHYDWPSNAPLPQPSPQPIPPPSMAQPFDVVDRGIITMDQARELFEIYCRDLTPHFPAVVFPDSTDLEELRISRPTLFLAAIAAASGKVDPHLYSTLHSEVITAYAHRTLVLSEKNLELVQSMLITVIWYYPPGTFRQLKFFEYISMATAMAMEIGIGSTSKRSKTASPAGPEATSMTSEDILAEELLDLEKRRTYLACYLASTTVAMNLRRPTMLRYSKRTGDCIEVLSQSPNASWADKEMSRWGKLVVIAEEVNSSFSFDDPAGIVSLSEPRVQLMLKGFERRVEAWKKEVDAEGGIHVSLLFMYRHMGIYIHELSMHDDHLPEDFKPPYRMNSIFVNEANRANTAQYIDSLAACITSAQNTLDLFLSTDIETLRCFPVFTYVRMLYSMVVLVKLQTSANATTSPIGGAIDSPSLRIDEYFERLINHLMLAVGPVEFRSAYTFCGGIMRLRKWHKDQEVQSSVLGGEEPLAKTLFNPNDALTPPGVYADTSENPASAENIASTMQLSDKMDESNHCVFATVGPMASPAPISDNGFQYSNTNMRGDEDLMAMYNDMGNSYDGDIQDWDPSMINTTDLSDFEMDDTLYSWFGMPNTGSGNSNSS
ncbi:hypothetical protein BP6252_01732 [Coleophoma cylindrospora]|uniref:Zn(2)-C6 fungal-type domain-containing protein n=1 Tax=Coleophoma cylindrospora TaxID=1849047 RepID=A0A3D8STQ5_9HELO|nr:hypothetical protein BP6252_01732 [Coleophoma cylindrospora]